MADDGRARLEAVARGTTAGRYTLLGRLARGGMAEIFLARTQGPEGFARVVVLKRILPQLAGDPEFVQMFLDEARLAAQLDHPNVAAVHDIGRDGDDYFFTMPYFHGEDLRTILRTAARKQVGLPLEHTLAIIAGVASGLHHAHERIGIDGKPLGIVHRDVSPSNVLVTYEGGVKLVDFGIAKAASSQHATRPSTRKGKSAYMSPEQCRGRPLDRRSDIFSLGILMWELTTGRRLFRAEDEFAIMNRIVNHDVDPPSEVVPDYPPALEAIVLRALARDLEDRYPDARAMQRDIEAFAHAEHLSMSPSALGEFLERLVGPRPLPWASAELTEPEPPAVDDDPTRVRSGSGHTVVSDRTAMVSPPVSVSRSARSPSRRIAWLGAGITLAAAGVAAFFFALGGGSPGSDAPAETERVGDAEAPREVPVARDRQPPLSAERLPPSEDAPSPSASAGDPTDRVEPADAIGRADAAVTVDPSSPAPSADEAQSIPSKGPDRPPAARPSGRGRPSRREEPAAPAEAAPRDRNALVPM